MARHLTLLLATALLAAPGEGQGEIIASQPKHITTQAQNAIRRGLEYLAREQKEDGSWRSAGSFGSYPTAMTGLAALAVAASGSTPTRGPYARVVQKATSYLISQAHPTNGLITSPMEEGRSMYGHGFSMLFLSQVYGMEEDLAKQQALRQVLKNGIMLIQRSQSRQGGWLYTPDSGGDEGSVTITQVQAMRGCRNGGIAVPKEVIAKAIAYIEKSQNPDGGIAYRVGAGPSRAPITAAACAVLYNAGSYDSPAAQKCFDFAWRMCKPGASGDGHYYYTQLYMAQACWQKGDRFWDEYFPVMRDRLLSLQQGNGSWNGDGVGTTYGTAIALIILQLPYSSLPILSR
ncbi:MAG: prenyltransferase/squalene oxidase repeat-containing protein [Planctomycetaceae bacterium]